MDCAIIVPRREEILGEREDSYLPGCILLSNHRSPHVFRTPEGKFFAWEDDWECGCCEPEEDDRCYEYWEINGEDIVSLSQGPT